MIYLIEIRRYQVEKFREGERNMSWKKKILRVILVIVGICVGWIVLCCVAGMGLYGCVSVVSCIYCKNSKMATDEECMAYLKKRYDRNFELVSSEILEKNPQIYLDDDMKMVIEDDEAETEPDSGTDTDIDGEPDSGTSSEIGSESSSRDESVKILTVKDENGVEFHLIQIPIWGIGKHYEACDDYCVQWLKSQTEIYETLMNSDYECEFYNEIGKERRPQAGFLLSVDNFYELQNAIEFAYSIASSKNAILPDYDDESDDIYGRAVYPRIIICSADCKSIYDGICYISFSSKCEKNETTLEEYLKKTKIKYVDWVREGYIDEELTDDVLEQYGPEEISVVTYDGEDMELVLMRDTGEENSDIYNPNGEMIYYIRDWVGDNVPIDVPRLTKFAKCAGYGVEQVGNDRTYFIKGTDEIVLDREGDSFTITKNGRAVIVQGNYRCKNGSVYITLTTEDLQKLFGIRIEIDKIHETAEVIMDE